jgi:hypothetical protein
LATLAQRLLSGSAVPLCHQVRTTFFSDVVPPPVLQAVRAPKASAAAAPTAMTLRMLRLFIIEHLSKVSTFMSKVIGLLEYYE